MTSVLLVVTLTAILSSLWVRRGTWGSRWEANLSLSVALQGCAVLLMSPWASTTVGQSLHQICGLWNVQQFFGHICLILAATAMIRHLLTRLADQDRARRHFNTYVAKPLRIGLPLLVAAFVVARETYHRDLFSSQTSTLSFAGYQLLFGSLLVYLLSYASRVLLIMREDPRSKPAANAYLMALSVGALGSVIQLSTAWAGVEVPLLIWLCSCIGVVGFAYEAARSWQAKVNWFTPGMFQGWPPRAA